MDDSINFDVVVKDTWGNRKFAIEDLGSADLRALWLQVSQEIVNRGVAKEDIVVAVYEKLTEF